MPLQRRMPKKGFGSPIRTDWQVVNVGDLERKGVPRKVNPSVLKEAGLIRRLRDPVKILGGGQLSKAFDIEADAFSKSAVEKITSAGGKAVGRS